MAGESLKKIADLLPKAGDEYNKLKDRYDRLRSKWESLREKVRPFETEMTEIEKEMDTLKPALTHFERNLPGIVEAMKALPKDDAPPESPKPKGKNIEMAMEAGKYDTKKA